MTRFRLLSVVVLAVVTLGRLSSLPAADEKDKKKDPETKIKAAIEKLPEADRKLAEAQRYCPTQPETRLGSMGQPVKLDMNGKTVFLCCESCRDDAVADPKATLVEVEKLKKIAAAMAKLKAEDRKLAEEQGFCAVMTKKRLGSMGTPVKLDIKGKTVFLCCKGCEGEAEADPDATLKKAAQLIKAKSN